MQGEFERQYNMLNPEQKRAVDTVEGPVFVMAGPGTGKTQILTLRIAQILRTVPGIQPENILALTFTNTAAYNMRERLGKMIGKELAYRMHISTFHAFAEDMIQKYPEYFPQFLGGRIASQVESLQSIEQILATYPSRFFSEFHNQKKLLPSMLSAFDMIKREGLTPEQFRSRAQQVFDASLHDDEMFYKRAFGKFKKGDIKPTELHRREKNRDRWFEIADLYEQYQNVQKSNRRYDFTDLIIFFIQGLQQHPDFKAEIQEQFQYVLVDEHQDTNDAQNMIIHELIDNPIHEGKPNIFVVGDNKQAIYRFAGADHTSFEALKNKVRDMVVIDLVHNYRSGQHVLNQAHALITQSTQHQETPSLSAFFSDYHGVIEMRTFSREVYEMTWIVQEIKRRYDAGESYDDMAILTRKNSWVHEIVSVLRHQGIPVCDRGKKNILTDIHIAKLVLLFQVIHDIENAELLAKLLHTDFLQIPFLDTTALLRRWKNTKHRDEKSLLSLISDQSIIREIIHDTDVRLRMTTFAEFLARAAHEAHNQNFQDFFVWVIRESGFLKYMMSLPDSAMHLSQLEKFFDEIKKESSLRIEFTLHDFIHMIHSFKKYDIKLEATFPERNGVSVMTYHGSKGLEFDTVFLYKTREQSQKNNFGITLPLYTFQDGSLDDERRLFYVALTRARKNIVMTMSLYDDQGKERASSPFVSELPDVTYISTTEFEQSHAHAFVQQFDVSQQSFVSLYDPLYWQERFQSQSLSVTALNNYYDDPLKYFFKNLLLLPDSLSPHLDLGNLVHGALELYFESAKEALSLGNEDALEQSVDMFVQRSYRYVRHRDRAVVLLRDYFHRWHHDWNIPLETEFDARGIVFHIDDTHEILLTGKIDKITRDSDGTITVWDYKTGKTYSQQDKKRREKLVRQAVFYKILLSEYRQGIYNPTRVIFDFIEPNPDTREYEQFVVDITRDDIERVQEEIRTLARAVYEGTLIKQLPLKNDTNEEYYELIEMMFDRHHQPGLFGEK